MDGGPFVRRCQALGEKKKGPLGWHSLSAKREREKRTPIGRGCSGGEGGGEEGGVVKGASRSSWPEIEVGGEGRVKCAHGDHAEKREKEQNTYPSASGVWHW